MTTTLEVVDDRLIIAVPPDFAQAHDLKPGSVVELTGDHTNLSITPVNGLAAMKRGDIRQLVDAITEENQHDLLDWGPPVGKEIW